MFNKKNGIKNGIKNGVKVESRTKRNQSYNDYFSLCRLKNIVTEPQSVTQSDTIRKEYKRDGAKITPTCQYSGLQRHYDFALAGKKFRLFQCVTLRREHRHTLGRKGHLHKCIERRYVRRDNGITFHHLHHAEVELRRTEKQIFGLDTRMRQVEIYFIGDNMATVHGYSSDGMERLTIFGILNYSAPLLKHYEYEYDAVGNMTKKHDMMDTSKSESYSYDEFNRRYIPGRYF